MPRGVVVDEPEPLEFGLVVDEPGVVVEPGVVDDPGVGDEGEFVGATLLVPGSHGGATCPGAEPACGSLWTRPEFVELGLFRAFVPSCVVDDPLRFDVVLLPLDDPLCGLVDAEPLPEDVRPDVDPLPDVVLLPVLDEEPFAGVQGICVVLDGACVCPLDEPFVELCAAAYPPNESAAANANALIVVMYRFISGAPVTGWMTGGKFLRRQSLHAECRREMISREWKRTSAQWKAARPLSGRCASV